MEARHVGQQRMLVVDALRVLIDLRRADDIVITNQASARIWPKLSQQPLDLHYNPSAMGGAIPLALGLAVARPERQVLVITGDGSLLMNLGALVTVVSTTAANLTIVVLENGIYEVTGGQKTPATNRPVDLAAVALAAGFPSARCFCELADWQGQAAAALALPGPRCICLQVLPTPLEYLSNPTPPLAAQLATLCRALGSSN